MLSVRKRDRVYWLEGRFGSRRIQASIGTRNHDAALLSKNRIERALMEGSSSEEWPQLRKLLPKAVFEKLAALVEYVEQPRQRPHEWKDLRDSFAGDSERRIILGKLRNTTWTRYQHTLSEFANFLETVQIRELTQITRSVVEQFKTWRAGRIKKRKFSRGGRGLALDAAILHRVFSHAIELEMVLRNPVRMEGRPGDDPECGAQPFKTDELSKLREAAGPDLLAFLVLR